MNSRPELLEYDLDGIAIEKSRERSDRSEKRERREVKFFGNLTFEKFTFERSR